MPETGVSFRYFLPAPALRGMITSYYTLEVDGPLEELLFPEWANIRLLLEGQWTQSFGDGRVITHKAPAALMSGVISRTARVSAPPGRLVASGSYPPAGRSSPRCRPATTPTTSPPSRSSWATPPGSC